MRSVIGAIVTLMLAACSTPSVRAPSPSATPTSPAPASGAVTATPSLSAARATPSRTPFPSPTPIVDLAQAFRPIASGWRPSGPTLMVVTTDGDTSTLVGLRVGARGLAAPATAILRFVPGPFDVRSDGGALALQVATDRGARIAVWDIRTGTGRWVTAAGPDAAAATPVWSADGKWIYYATAGPAPELKGVVHRVAADGTGETTLATLDRFGGITGLTPDGRGLIWSRGQAGGSTEILDLVTGVSKHLDDVAAIASIRERQPRVLLSVGGCCAGYPGGSLVLWDDAAMTSRVVAERGPGGDPAWGGGAWDPTGSRFVTVRYDAQHRYDGILVVVYPDTGRREDLAVTGSGQILWLDEGIVYSSVDVRGPSVELKMLPSVGGGAVSLYKGDNLHRIAVVRP